MACIYTHISTVAGRETPLIATDKVANASYSSTHKSWLGRHFHSLSPSCWSFSYLWVFLSCVGCTQRSGVGAEEWSIFISVVIRCEDIWDVICYHMTLRLMLLGFSHWLHERMGMSAPILLSLTNGWGRQICRSTKPAIQIQIPDLLVCRGWGGEQGTERWAGRQQGFRMQVVIGDGYFPRQC